MEQFGRTLENFLPFQESYEQASEELGSYIYDSSGKALMAQGALKKALDLLHSNKQAIDPLPPGIARTRLQWSWEKEVKFLLALLDLEESMEDFMKREIRYAKRNWKSASPAEKETTARQIKALLDQQSALLQAYQTLSAENSYQPLMAARLKGAKGMIEGQQRALSKLWKEAEKSLDVSRLPPLEFGGGEWNALIAKRPLEEPGFVGRTLSKLNPDNWSETTKNVVHCFLLLNQLVPQVMSFNQTQQVESMKAAAIQAVPAEKRAIVEQECSFLGTMLADKYETLHKPDAVKGLTNRYPHKEELRAEMKKIVQEYGNKHPSPDEQIKIVERFKETALLHSSPTSSLSFGEWWETFTRKEGEPARVPTVISYSCHRNGRERAEREPETRFRKACSRMDDKDDGDSGKSLLL